MRKFSVSAVVASLSLIALPALAADLPIRGVRAAPVAPMVPALRGFTWTGCFIGGNVGYGVSPKDWSLQDPLLLAGTRLDLGSHDATGVVAGGQIGCDLQMQGVVVGVEGMFDWAGMDDSHLDPFVRVLRMESELNWVATATGRLGLAVDRALFYVRGGAAWVDEDFTVSVGGLRARGGDTEMGWTVGGGVEWAFAPAWSARVEYNYLNFDTQRPRFCIRGTGCGTGFDIDQDAHLFTVGLNYRFSGL